tara:strand:- start:399 stop:1304 length:906 start_codon:yes stop_codon:yes gene_type:complete
MSRASPLSGRVAVVTGASRGIGKGIAIGLGEAGATVYVTGRTRGTGDRTIDTTAELVSLAGGQGLAVEVDHAIDGEIDGLFRLVESEHGGLDILVNNVFKIPDPPAWEGGFWEHPLEIWDDQVGIGLRSHYVASRSAAPLLFRCTGSMIFNITSPAGFTYLFNAAYSIGKAALDRMTHDLGIELLPKGVSVIGLRPGPVRTEFIQDQASAGVSVLTEGVETPIFIGRVVAAIATDQDRFEMTGRVHWTTDLGSHYRLVDEDGAVPVSARERFKDAPRADPYASEPMTKLRLTRHGGVEDEN